MEGTVVMKVGEGGLTSKCHEDDLTGEWPLSLHFGVSFPFFSGCHLLTCYSPLMEVIVLKSGSLVQPDTKDLSMIFTNGCSEEPIF